MAVLEIEVNGVWQDFSDVVKSGGFRVARNVMHTDKTGRSKLTAAMHIGVLAKKRTLSIECLRMSKSRIRELSKAIGQNTFRARYEDFDYDEPPIKTFYNTKIESAVLYKNDDGESFWDGATFNIIEV